jgi:hypothetical protein
VIERVTGYQVRTYIPEPKPKGRRHWEGKRDEQQAIYGNRRRVRGEYGKSLLLQRGELMERGFAHCYDTGGMRRTHLRGRENTDKRQLIHVGDTPYIGMLGCTSKCRASESTSPVICAFHWFQSCPPGTM